MFQLFFIIASEVGHEDTADIEKIPDPVPKGHFSMVKLSSNLKPTFISFDLETTDLSKNWYYFH